MQARLEWNNVIKSLNEKQRYIAASIASELNWHDRNIIVAAIDQGKINNPNKTSELDQNAYLHLKYPLGYQESIIKYAKKYHLDPAWVFAISRQESAFISDAKSSAGALGLMQLMPTTAQKLARKNNIPYHDKLSLLNETTNISLGSAYLHNMLNDNKGNQILATAAYNAGPGRVRQWMKNSKPVATDVWIELVPFYETRNYLKRVITNTAVYRSRLGSGPMVLSENMPVTLEVSK
jgi:soluble lytic murein transglycosylase